MSTVMQTPQSIGQVLDSGFKLYQRSFSSLVLLSLAASFIGVLPQLPQLLNPTNTGLGLIGGLGSLVAGFIRLALTAAIILRLDDIASSRNALTAGSAFSGSFRFALPILGASILYGLATIVGFVLLVIPGLWISVSLAFFLYALVLDGKGVTGSLQASMDLVKGNWWRIAAIFTVALVLFGVLYSAILLIVGFFAPISSIFSTAAGGVRSEAVLIGFAVFLLFNAVLSTLLMPLIYSISLVAYRDLQLRKGGGDLAERIAAGA